MIGVPQRSCLYTSPRLFDTSDHGHSRLEELLGILFELSIPLIRVNLGTRPVVSYIGQKVEADHSEHFVHRVLVYYAAILLYILDLSFDEANGSGLRIEQLLLSNNTLGY